MYERSSVEDGADGRRRGRGRDRSPAIGVRRRTARASRQERVTFARGASSATIKGQTKGDADVDYLVRAAAGQTLSVSLKVSNRSNYFNVLPPGSQDVAMHVGQDGGPTPECCPPMATTRFAST